MSALPFHFLRTRFAWNVAPLLTIALWAGCGEKVGTPPSEHDGGLDAAASTSDASHGGGDSSTSDGSHPGADASHAADGSPGADASQLADSATSSDGAAGSEGGAAVGASVLEHHLHPTRDGAYTDANVTKAAAAAIHMDTAFTAKVTGTIYGQPLYVDGWKAGVDAVLVATNQNHVTALNGATGAPLWDVTLGPPVAQASLPCGQPYTSYGIMETPVIDLPSRTLYAESFQTPDGGTTKKHYVYAISIDDGATRPGWPVDIGMAVNGFDAGTQNDRGALTILNGTLYVPYAGLNGDCGTYHGWVIGISTSDPTQIGSYSTGGTQGGIWGAVSSDGTSVYAVTGNTGSPATWSGGEAVLRFTAGPKFSGATTDYFTPSNWATLDRYDGDLGSAPAILFDLPGATPSTLAAAMGKWGVVHLVNRANLGGVGTGSGTTGEGLFSLAFANVQNTENPPGSKGTGASYTSAKGRYVVLHSESNIIASVCPQGSGDLLALTVTATSPPKLVPAWCAASGGKGSPMATTTDGTSNALVWIVSTGGSNRLLAFDGDTGAAVFTGGAAGDQMGTIAHWTSPIVAKGRFVVGGTGAVYAFTTR